MKQIITRPIISEKSMGLAPVSKYVFRVGKHANKPEIAAEIEKFYKVVVKSVNVANVSGKYKKFKGKIGGQTSNWKKAIVTLAKGQKISDFEVKK